MIVVSNNLRHMVKAKFRSEIRYLWYTTVHTVTQKPLLTSKFLFFFSKIETEK